MDNTLADMKKLGIDYIYALTQEDNSRIHYMLKKYGFNQGCKMIWFERK